MNRKEIKIYNVGDRFETTSDNLKENIIKYIKSQGE